MRRIAGIAWVILIALSVLPSAGRAHVAIRNCGTLTIGPAGDKQGAVGGAVCLLRAFEQRCLPANYRLSIFGVDTATTDRFELVLRNARCRIDVFASFRVIPQPKRLHHGRCTTLRRQHSHVIATGCLGSGIPRSIWLDARGRTP